MQQYVVVFHLFSWSASVDITGSTTTIKHEVFCVPFIFSYFGLGLNGLQQIPICNIVYSRSAGVATTNTVPAHRNRAWVAKGFDDRKLPSVSRPATAGVTIVLCDYCSLLYCLSKTTQCVSSCHLLLVLRMFCVTIVLSCIVYRKLPSVSHPATYYWCYECFVWLLFSLVLSIENYPVCLILPLTTGVTNVVFYHSLSYCLIQWTMEICLTPFPYSILYFLCMFFGLVLAQCLGWCSSWTTGCHLGCDWSFQARYKPKQDEPGCWCVSWRLRKALCSAVCQKGMDVVLA